MRTLLICHAGDRLNEIGLARWLGSFSELVGVVAIRERQQQMWRRIRRETKRVGLLRFPDVLAFRLYYRFFHASRDAGWEAVRLKQLCETYPDLGSTPILYTAGPNSAESHDFIRAARPDIVIARCKVLLKESVFTIPPRGTLVMHPGICPEYRNAHGCFWALANGDRGRVGMTLLRVDKGVDTGAVFGYFTCNYDEINESHIVIQHRVVFDNLDAIRAKLEQIYDNAAEPIDTSNRKSAVWGQPWLSRHLRWKWDARKRRRKHERNIALVS